MHSLKDLPTEQPEGLALGAVLSREDPSEVLVSQNGRRLADLPPGARLGTSSLRRRAQVMAVRPDLDIVDIRGNVPTRIEKVRRGEYDATLLALAGLRRLELTDAATRGVRAATSWCRRPARARSRCRCARTTTASGGLVAAIDDLPTRLATAAERRVLNALEGGCQAPIGALATWTAPGRLHLVGLVAESTDGVFCARPRSGPSSTSQKRWRWASRSPRRSRAQGARGLIDAARQLAGAGDPT